MSFQAVIRNTIRRAARSTRPARAPAAARTVFGAQQSSAPKQTASGLIVVTSTKSVIAAANNTTS
jgi:hypothetical protein